MAKESEIAFQTAPTTLSRSPHSKYQPKYTNKPATFVPPQIAPKTVDSISKPSTAFEKYLLLKKQALL
jgi:hypothetical protein